MLPFHLAQILFCRTLQRMVSMALKLESGLEFSMQEGSMDDTTTNRGALDYLERGDLRVAPELASFVENEALAGTGVDPAAFWAGLSTLAHDFGPRNAELLQRRAALQAEIDAWHVKRQNQPHDHEAYKALLTEIGYLLPEGDDFSIETANVDPEIAAVPGPQLVVPITNARFALNAANARWGRSL